MLSIFNGIGKERWACFLSITFGYGFYYVTRLSFNLAKNAMVEEGVFTTSEIGYIGSALFSLMLEES